MQRQQGIQNVFSWTGFVTRIEDNAVYDVTQQHAIHSEVIEGVTMEVPVKNEIGNTKLIIRKLTFYYRTLKRVFEFITNLFDMRADLVAAIYKLRWQIELLFMQLKHNFPLKYFMGDNENTNKIPIYCALTTNLLWL